jgi:hypothetical protein
MRLAAAVILILISATSFCQGIIKGANEIRVANVSFDTVMNRLLDLGYTIDQSDRQFFNVKTDGKSPCKDCNGEMLLAVRIKDSVAYIRGKFSSGVIQDHDIENQKWGMYKATFAAMNDFALSLNRPVQYFKF